MRAAAPLARIAIAACAASCASAPPGSDTRSVDALGIAPYAMHEECFDLALRDRLDYRYQSSEPIDFDIRYRNGGVVVAPIVRPHSTSDSDIFEALVAARYCASWQAGAEPATIDYRLLVRRKAAPR